MTNKLNSDFAVDGFDYSFLEDEVRNGFYVPAVMKQFWAAEIKTLEMFDAVCKKHGLRYYADWGSLLGAVRHGGFVPWDDDLDVMMLRDDYGKLLKLWEEHPEEFPENFEVRSFRNRPDLTEFHGVVVGSKSISFAPEHLKKFYGFPYIPGIDIFILDYKSRDDAKQKEMAGNALFVIAVADEIGAGKLDTNSIKANLKRIEQMPGVKYMPTEKGMTNEQLRIALYEVAETLFAMFEDEKSDRLIQNVPWGLLNPDRYIPKENYDLCIKIPFEYSSIAVPGAYDTMLRNKYGNYLRVVKGVGAHEYPCFAEAERNIMSSLDFEFPHFSYSDTIISSLPEKKAEAKANGWKSIACECLEGMKKYLVDAESEIGFLADMQQLTVDLGEFLESTGRVEDNVIAHLERLCEKIYQSFTNPESKDEYRLLIEEFAIAEKVVKEITDREEIVFIPFKQDGWEKLRPFFNEETSGRDREVIILDTPFYHKQFDGAIIEEKKMEIVYPENATVIPYENYNFELYHPDKIYIQFPYDSWNPVMTIPVELYAERLASLTDKLVYVPWFETDDFTSEDKPNMVNAKYYVNMPGVVYADEIVLTSQAKKEIYIKILKDFAGETAANYTADRIFIKSSGKVIEKNKGTKKLFYYLGISSFLQSPQNILNVLKRNYEIFKEEKDKIEVVLCIDSVIEKHLPEIDGECWKELCNIRQSWKNEGIISFCGDISPKNAVDMCDAYYGDPGRFVRAFAEKEKPIMIQNAAM